VTEIPVSVAPRQDIDARMLPSYAFGNLSVMWWGTVGIMAIEGTVFALAIMMYLYVRTRVDAWPPSVLPPELTWGTLNVLILLVSGIPNHYAKRAGEKEDVHGVRIWLGVALLFAIAFLVVRWLEFGALNVRWDDNAYGSAVWFLLGLHTTHLLTDAFDSAVLFALFWTGPLEGKRFVDVTENAMYWWFVVLAWLPIYGVIYWAPRWL
jgi:heme/copper-type cytochrome/quinol oxidase subunit 3